VEAIDPAIDARVVPELLEIIDEDFDTSCFPRGAPKSSDLPMFFFSSSTYFFLNFSTILKSAKFFG
jgi:hypothetical protein